ncbi:inositol monophosphatase family protein [Variovorax robiniae]|uniref:Inositol monophosphatase family protein n=1 Tax=Variovorax robiniae TaxID=1836199 RepID=A0ABU8XLL1_9BURK
MRGAFELSNLQRLVDLVAEAALREIMPRFTRLTAIEVRQKTSAFDVVTEADEAAESFITRALETDFQGCAVIGEESAGRDPAMLDHLATAPLCFLVDPLDGTKNFSSGLPLFGVMVAVIEAGEVVAGVIHDPVCRNTAVAMRDAGAWSQAEDGSRLQLKVANPVPVREMEGIVGTNFLSEPMRSTVNANLARLGMTNWFRCAAHEYRLAAQGHCHVLFYNRLMPWDHAAGWLIHREAGGIGAHFDGSAYLPSHQSGGLLYAPDESSWYKVIEALLGA